MVRNTAENGPEDPRHMLRTTERHIATLRTVTRALRAVVALGRAGLVDEALAVAEGTLRSLPEDTAG